VYVIESVELVVAALVGGTAAGVSNATSAAVSDAYDALKSLARKALLRGAGHDDAEVEEKLADPFGHRAELAAALSKAGVETDVELVAAAQRLLSLVDRQGTAAGKYHVVLRGNKGVQVGDNNTQTINFGDA
jgi:hypothetical protein